MANSLTAYTPELWSQEAIAILRERIVLPRLVRRDFSADLAQYGDTVNTRKPSKMTAGTVDPDTGVSVQNAAATNVAVTLNQHKHATFRISDREASKSFQNLVEQFLDPAVLAVANAIDLSLAGLYADIPWLIDVASAGAIKDKINAARTRLNKNLAPSEMRYAVMSDDDDGAVANLDILSKVNESGGSQTLREGAIGRFKGFDFFRSSNIVNVGSPGVRHNILFQRDAFTLVVRNLATATGSTPGAMQTVAQDPDAGLSLRMTLSYNPTLLSTQVTVDTLYGVKTLDSSLAAVLRASY